MEDGKMGNTTTIRAVLAILQWWGFNVTVIIMNKWIFQVRVLLFFSLDQSSSVISHRRLLVNLYLWEILALIREFRITKVAPFMRKLVILSFKDEMILW